MKQIIIFIVALGILSSCSGNTEEILSNDSGSISNNPIIELTGTGLELQLQKDLLLIEQQENKVKKELEIRAQEEIEKEENQLKNTLKKQENQDNLSLDKEKQEMINNLEKRYQEEQKLLTE